MKYLLILMFACVLLLSCNATNKKVEFTDLYPKNYNDSIRWKRFDNLKSFLKREDYKTLDKIKKKYKNSTINSSKIILIKKINEYDYKVIVEREEMLIPSNILKINKYIQYWNYDRKAKYWKIKKEIKDKEE